MFDLNELSGTRRHVYFCIILVLLLLLAATIEQQFHSAPRSERKELTEGAKRLIETGAIVKDLY